MCGRFAQFADFKDIKERFYTKDKKSELLLPFKNYNCAPGDKILVVREENGREIDAFSWGLVTDWTREKHINLINIRSDTLMNKETFLRLLKQKRCLIPADGFYEWKKDGNEKKPYYIYMADKKLFAFAGLWNSWVSPEGEETKSCVIITTDANELVAPIHNRMPVILPEDKLDIWLSKSPGEKELLDLLKPYPSSLMRLHAVSKAVNNVKNNSPDFIKPVEG